MLDGRRRSVGPGDEITIRILHTGPFDEPYKLISSPKKTLDDPEFGQMNYYVDAWDADIGFDSHPIESAHIHLWADESGPTQLQREILRDLRVRHVQL